MTEQVSFGETQSWLDRALFDEAEFRRGLNELKIDEKSKREILTQYRKEQEPLRWATKLPKNIQFRDPDGAAAYISRKIEMATRSIKNGIQKLLSGLEQRIVGTELRVIKIPIFYLTAPGVKGSKISYSETQSQEGENGWEVTVFGIGMGSTRVFSFQSTSSFSVENMQRKMVFAPAVVEVSLVTTYRYDEKIGEGLRVELCEKKTREAFTLGVSQLLGKFPYRPRSNVQARWHPLAEDKSDAVASFEDHWCIDESCSLDVGVDAFSAKVKVKVGVRRRKEITLKLELPVGRNYGILPLDGVNGIWWEVNEGPLYISPNTANRADV